MVEPDILIEFVESIIDDIDNLMGYVYGLRYCSKTAVARIYNELEGIRDKVVKLRFMLVSFQKSSIKT